jgi:hypothetical protein
LTAFRPDLALKKQLTERAEELKRTKKAAEDALAAAVGAIEDTKEFDAPVAEAEAALAEATAAASAKDYRLAFEKAQEAQVRALRGLGARAGEILTSSRSLLELTRSLGADISEGEAILAQAEQAIADEDPKGAIRLAKKAWKKNEKVLHEHLSASFSSAQALIHTAKTLGRDVSVAEDVLSRSRRALEADDYESALAYVRECLEAVTADLQQEVDEHRREVETFLAAATDLGADVERVRSLLDRAEKDVDDLAFDRALASLRQARTEGERALQKTLAGQLENLEPRFREAEALKADIGSARATFAEAERAATEGRYGDAAQLAKRGFQELHSAQFQRVVAAIAASRGKFVAAKNMGADLKVALGHLNGARDALQRGEFAAALKAAQQAETEVDGILEEVRGIEGRIREMQRILAEAERQGVNVTTGKRLLDRAGSAWQGRDISLAADLLQRSEEELERAQYDRAMEIMERAEFVLTVGERVRADVGDAGKLLEEAVVAAKEKDHAKAIAQAQRCRDMAETAMRDRLQESLTGLRATLEFLGEDAASVHAFARKAEASLDANDFEAAFGYLEQGQRLAEGRTRDRAVRFHDALRMVLDVGEAVGVDVSPLAAVRDEAAQAVEGGRFADVIGLQERVGKDLSAALDQIFQQVKGRVLEAHRLGIDIDAMRDLLKKAKVAQGVDNPNEALSLLKECHARTTKAIDRHREVHNAVASAAALVAEAKKRGVDVSKTLRRLLESKKAFESHDYGRALELAKRTKAETEKSLVLYTAAQRILTARERFALAGKLGVDVSHVRGSLDEAKEAMKARRYQEALDLADRADKDLRDLIKDRVASQIAAVESNVATLEGVDLVSQETQLIRARELLERGEYGQAAELATRAREGLQALKRKGQEAEVTLHRAQDLLTDLEALRIEAPRAQDLVDRAAVAYKAGRYDAALNLAKQALDQIDAERDENVAKTFRRFEEAVAKAKADGVDVRSAERLLQEARAQLKERRYREALALAMQSEGEVEKVAQQQEIASSVVATAERRLKGLGRSLPGVASMIEQAREAMAAADYVKAMDLGIRASEEFHRLREAVEETMDVKGRADRMVATARSLGADSSKIERIYAHAEEALQAGDPVAARHAYEQCVDWGIGLCEMAIKELEGTVRELSEVGKRLGLDVGGAARRLSEAKSLAQDEQFEEAFERIVAAREELKNAIIGHVVAAINETRSALDHAKDLGADVKDGRKLLKEAEKALAEGRFEQAVGLAKRSIEGVEADHVAEKRFLDLTFQTETLLHNTRKFGVDVRDAEAALARALETKKDDLAKALELAEKAREMARRALEAFAPSLEASLDVTDARIGEWTEATLTLSNVGKALAKDVRVRILGDAEVEGLAPISAIRGRGVMTLPLRIKLNAAGSVPLAIQILSHRVLDGKEYAQELLAQVDVAEPPEAATKRLVADKDTRCPICRGLVKKGFTVARCTCGREFHELCASRVARCPGCFAPLSVDGKAKTKLMFGLD